jgi:hypothetical protein
MPSWMNKSVARLRPYRIAIDLPTFAHRWINSYAVVVSPSDPKTFDLRAVWPRPARSKERLLLSNPAGAQSVKILEG